MEFTPGPWTTDEREHNDPYQHVRIVGGGRAIAELWIDDAPVPEYNAEQYANARLIATAPDLLKALAGMEEAYCRAGPDLTRAQRHEDRLRLIAARAAIATATGRRL